MVLFAGSPYRAVLERYLEFRREAYVELDDPGLNLPLDNLPHLYELWGTLQVIDVLLEQARTLDYDSVEHRLARQIGRGVYVKVLPDGSPAVTLRRSRRRRAGASDSADEPSAAHQRIFAASASRRRPDVVS